MHRKKEKEMFAAYRIQANEILSAQDRFIKTGRELKIGFESEVAIYNENFAIDTIETVRNSVIQGLPGITDVELGAAQIELRTPPIDIFASYGLRELTSLYEMRFNLLLAEARKTGCSILRVGANSFLPIKNTPRTDKPKYRMVPDFYNEHRHDTTDTFIGIGNDRIDIGDAAIVSLFQSFQVNLEANSFEDACDKMNRSLMISPYLLACAGNARYLECFDTKLQDMRMLAWEKSHDTRMQDLRLLSWEKAFDIRTQKETRMGHALRIGLPERYFKNIADYLDRVGRFPFILHNPESAFAIGIGMTWLDARIKFIGDSLVVELRSLPTQPTQEEEMELTLCYIGRLADSRARNECLLPIEYVRENRLSAMLYGSHRSMWFMSDEGSPERLPFHIGIKREAERIKAGLKLAGLSQIKCEKILRNTSPSDRLAKALRNIGGKINTRTMKQALQETGMLIY